MSAQRWQEPNLARAPFVNERPVRRLAITLWLLFGVVGATGLWTSQTIRRETGTRVAELVRLNAETESARERATALEAELRRADLPAQNVRAEFLNRRIAERSFSWNRLLEAFTHELPRGVRLLRLSPEVFTRERRRATAGTQAVAATRVALRVTGEAEETEALLEFVDRLFQASAFDRPNLSREVTKNDLKIQFELAVDYLPQVADEPAATAAAVATTPATGAAALVSAGEPALESPAAGASSDGPTKSGDATAAGQRLPPPGAAAGADPRAAAAASRVQSADELAAPDEGMAPTAGRRASPAGDAERAGVRPSGSVLGGGRGAVGVGGSPPGAAAPPAAAPGSGKKFPFDLIPTALQPYASSTGGRR